MPARVVRLLHEIVGTEPRVELEYAEVRDAHDLTPVVTVDGSVLVALAARVGSTRLIDNARVDVDGARVTADLGVGGGSPCNAR